MFFFFSLCLVAFTVLSTHLFLFCFISLEWRCWEGEQRAEFSIVGRTPPPSPQKKEREREILHYHVTTFFLHHLEAR